MSREFESQEGPSMLGSSEQELSESGQEYVAKYTGVGYIDSDGERTFLSDVPYNVIWDLIEADTDADRDGEGGIEVPWEKTLEMSHLVPHEWMGKQIVYEITVRAAILKSSTQSDKNFLKDN